MSKKALVALSSAVPPLDFALIYPSPSCFHPHAHAATAVENTVPNHRTARDQDFKAVEAHQRVGVAGDRALCW